MSAKVEQRRAERFNRLYPLGTLVRYRKGDQWGLSFGVDGCGVGKVTGVAQVNDCIALVAIQGAVTLVPLSHVSPLTNDEIAELEPGVQLALGLGK